MRMFNDPYDFMTIHNDILMIYSQNLPNLGGVSGNAAIDMLNLMQFHQLISLNFMNLAPPLIFGASGANTSSENPVNAAAAAAAAAADIASNTNPIANAQKVQLLQQQAAAVQQVSTKYVFF